MDAAGLSRLSVAAASALLIGAAPAEVPPLPMNVGGRVMVDDFGGRSFGWPGIYFESRFRGRGVRIRFEAPDEHMRLLVDGIEKVRFRRPGAVDLLLGDLPDGEHVVRLEKQSESQT